MDSTAVARASAAAMSVASAAGLTVNDVAVLNNSNKLALRLLPCDVLARVAIAGDENFDSELEIAQKLAEQESPVARLHPLVEPRVYEHDAFKFTLWTYYEQVSGEASPSEYAKVLARLHTGMAKVSIEVPHFTDRIAEALWLVGNPSHTPELTASDRKLLSSTLQNQKRIIIERVGEQQLLHGEPHPGNLLNTDDGPLFMDLETCCSGPVEFDLAHVPEAVSRCYGDFDEHALQACRILVLAMVAAWRWEVGDQLPNGKDAGRKLIAALRNGPPWQPLDIVMRSAGVP